MALPMRISYRLGIDEVGGTDGKLIVRAHTVRSYTATMSLAFIEQNWVKRVSYHPSSSDPERQRK
jgi:hypothetical protein